MPSRLLIWAIVSGLIIGTVNRYVFEIDFFTSTAFAALAGGGLAIIYRRCYPYGSDE